LDRLWSELDLIQTEFLRILEDSQTGTLSRTAAPTG
jgi:hypothetical protein